MAWGDKVQGASGTTNATFAGTPVAGNLLVCLAFSTAAVTFTAPTGWTGGTAVAGSGGSARGFQLSWKVSDGTETAAIAPASGTPSGVCIVQILGPFDPTPLDVQNAQLTVSGTVHASPAVTPTAGVKRLVVAGCAVDATGRTWATERVNASVTGVVEDVDASAVLFHLVVASTTGSYTADATVSSTAVIGEAGIAIF